jgi:hypothetical protein
MIEIAIDLFPDSLSLKGVTTARADGERSRSYTMEREQ